MGNINEETVFIKLNEYKESLSLFEQLKGKIKEAEETLERIEKLKDEENAEVDLWRNSIREIDKKIEYVDNLIVENNK